MRLKPTWADPCKQPTNRKEEKLPRIHFGSLASLHLPCLAHQELKPSPMKNAWKGFKIFTYLWGDLLPTSALSCKFSLARLPFSSLSFLFTYVEVKLLTTSTRLTSLQTRPDFKKEGTKR